MGKKHGFVVGIIKKNVIFAAQQIKRKAILSPQCKMP